MNIFLIWYVINLLSKFLFVSENVGYLFIELSKFEEFVESFYKMDSFYGDPIVEELVGRTKMLVAEIKEFESIYEYSVDIESLEEEYVDDAEEAEVFFATGIDAESEEA